MLPRLVVFAGVCDGSMISLKNEYHRELLAKTEESFEQLGELEKSHYIHPHYRSRHRHNKVHGVGIDAYGEAEQLTQTKHRKQSVKRVKRIPLKRQAPKHLSTKKRSPKRRGKHAVKKTHGNAPSFQQQHHKQHHKKYHAEVQHHKLHLQHHKHHHESVDPDARSYMLIGACVTADEDKSFEGDYGDAGTFDEAQKKCEKEGDKKCFGIMVQANADDAKKWKVPAVSPAKNDKKGDSSAPKYKYKLLSTEPKQKGEEKKDEKEKTDTDKADDKEAEEKAKDGGQEESDSFLQIEDDSYEDSESGDEDSDESTEDDSESQPDETTDDSESDEGSFDESTKHDEADPAADAKTHDHKKAAADAVDGDEKKPRAGGDSGTKEEVCFQATSPRCPHGVDAEVSKDAPVGVEACKSCNEGYTLKGDKDPKTCVKDGNEQSKNEKKSFTDNIPLLAGIAGGSIVLIISIAISISKSPPQEEDWEEEEYQG